MLKSIKIGRKTKLVYLFLLLTLTVIVSCNKVDWRELLKNGKGGKDDGGTRTECIDKSRVNPSKSCPKAYVPVCGCDGVTYDNSCEADKKGVTGYTQGACKRRYPADCFDTTKMNPDAKCDKIIDPVCGCDGQTYPNACEAEKMGLLMYKKGRCNGEPDCMDEYKVDPTLNCPQNIDPVCGCNGVTYNNACEADKWGVLKYTPGKCR